MTTEAQSLAETKRECKSLACAIQACLKRRDFDEKRCVKEVEVWRQCDLKLKEIEKRMQEERGTKESTAEQVGGAKQKNGREAKRE